MYVIEDSRRFARSKRNALRGVTLKVSTEMLTLFYFPSVLTMSGFVSLVCEPLAVEPTWFLSGVLGFCTRLLDTAAGNRTPQNAYIYR